MKMSEYLKNPELLTSTSKSRYQYEILINKKKVICQSHIETVITTLKLLAEHKKISLSDLEAEERLAGFKLMLDVSEMNTDTMSAEILKVFPKFKNRYNFKKLLVVDKSKYLVCNQWTVANVDKFINRFMTIANSGITNKKDLNSVIRLEKA